MRRTLRNKISYLLLLFSVQLFSQMQIIDYGGMPKPDPAVASVSTNFEAPISMATGIPNIQVPIAGIISSDSYIGENLLLSYNPFSVYESEYVSEVGSGWDLFSGGVIARTVKNGIDEIYDNASAPGYIQNQFDDVYHYNLPNGISGKFKILRQAGNTFAAYNMTANNVKIDYTRTNNTATLIVTSFTITDDKGYQYKFEDVSKASYAQNKMFNSAYFLTKIYNPNQIELLTYEYQKSNIFKEGSTTDISYQNCKIRKINSIGLGKITFEYLHEPSFDRTMTDPYKLTSITVENNYGKQISKHLFEYSSFTYKRNLSKIKKVDQSNPTGVPWEVTKLEYVNFYGPDLPNYPSGIVCEQNITLPFDINNPLFLLNKITYPTGGTTEFNFEQNEHFIDKSTPEYIQSLSDYIDPIIQHIEFKSSNNFNTGSGNISLILWKILGTPNQKKRFYIDFSASRNPPSGGPFIDPGDGSSNLGASFKVDGQTVPQCDIIADINSIQSKATIELYPGNHSIEIVGTNVSGTVSISELVNSSPPYQNKDYAAGIRIKNIKVYKSSTETNPEKIINYSYNQFDNSNNSSGHKFSNENIEENSEYVLYKNIRTTEGTNQGRNDYYFKVPTDYIDTTGSFSPGFINYNFTKSGLFDKNIKYSVNNQIVLSTENTYEFQKMKSSETMVLSNGQQVTTGVIKKLVSNEKSYINATDYLENTKETEFSNFLRNFQPIKIKTTSTDGDTFEKTFEYPNELIVIGQSNEYEHINNANIKGVPIFSQEKKNEKLITTSHTKFANNSLFPTSIIIENPVDNSLETAIRYDIYDTRGNLRQYTTSIDANGNGYPTTIIYGYNGTLPIAKIEGATQSNIDWVLIPNGQQDIVTLSNNDVDETSEKAFIAGLDNYRNAPELKSFQITTYTYDPLIGVTSITPPSGIREIYKYDANGQLKSVIDVNGNILQDYKYNTKQQP